MSFTLTLIPAIFWLNFSSMTSSRSLIQASRDGARLAAVVAMPAAKQTSKRRAAMVRV